MPIPPRPGCDIPARADAAITAARLAAAARARHEKSAEREHTRQWKKSHKTQHGGQRWQLPPLQRWETPTSVAESYRGLSSARIGCSPRRPDPRERRTAPTPSPPRSPTSSRSALTTPRSLVPLAKPLSSRPSTISGGHHHHAHGSKPVRSPAVPDGFDCSPRAMAAHLAALGMGTLAVERDIYGRLLPSQMASLRRQNQPEPWVF